MILGRLCLQLLLGILFLAFYALGDEYNAKSICIITRGETSTLATGHSGGWLSILYPKIPREMGSRQDWVVDKTGDVILVVYSAIEDGIT